MAKIRFKGVKRETFSWTSMGKAKSYSFGPDETKEVNDNDLPYLLSFGNFSALEEEVQVAPVVAMVVETKRVDPFITVTQPVLAPVVVEVKTPVVIQPVVPQDVVTPEEVEKEEAADKVDYTSFHKKDLIKLCKERKLDTIGNRDDLIHRCVQYDINQVK